MAEPAVERVSLRIAEGDFSRLHGHLFPGDGDEHGAVIKAGVAGAGGQLRLLCREVVCAVDGRDYVPGEHGYRMLTADFVADQTMACAREGLAYLAVHNHGGRTSVCFSPQDLASHERGYPAILDILGGPPCGALVLADGAVAGDIWFRDGSRKTLETTIVTGARIRELLPHSRAEEQSDPTFHRQTLLFGTRGQAILSRQKVGVIGAGGAGSLVVEYLARLGVGRLVVVDPERLDVTNLPRVVGARRRDALPWLTGASRPMWIRRVGERLATPKVAIAKRVARQANPHVGFHGIVGDITSAPVAQQFADCDYLFLAADSMQARLTFTALVEQYLIPGVQVGAKVQADRESGDILDVFAVERPVLPGQGCLACNQLIPSKRLQLEALSDAERRAQQYVDDPYVVAPSVITLNAMAVSWAVNDFLFAVTELADLDGTPKYVRMLPRQRDIEYHLVEQDERCRHCSRGDSSRYARGDSTALPVRLSGAQQ